MANPWEEFSGTAVAEVGPWDEFSKKAKAAIAPSSQRDPVPLSPEDTAQQQVNAPLAKGDAPTPAVPVENPEIRAQAGMDVQVPLRGGDNPTPAKAQEDLSDLRSFIKPAQLQGVISEVQPENAGSAQSTMTPTESVKSALEDLMSPGANAGTGLELLIGDPVRTPPRRIMSDEEAAQRGVSAFVQPTKTERAGDIAENTVAGLAKFLMSPAGVLLPAASMASPALGTIIGAGFAAQGIKDAPQAALDIYNASDAKSRDEATERLINDALMGVAGAKQIAGRPSTGGISPSESPASEIVPAIRVGEQTIEGNKGETHQDILKRFTAENPEQAADALSNFDTKENPNFFRGNGQDISREQLKEQHGVSDSQGLRDKVAAEAPKWTQATAEPKNVSPADVPTEVNPHGMNKRAGGSEAGFIPIPKEVQDFVKKGSEAVGKVVREIRDVKKMTPLDEATTDWSAKLQTSFAEAAESARDITKAAPKEAERNAMAVYREAAGDPVTLATWEMNAKQDWMRKAAGDAQNLSPEAIRLVGEIGKSYDALEARGNSENVLGSHRDNYVTHVWDVENKPGSSGKALKERFKFAKARSFDTFFDGDQAGFKPKTLDMAKLVPAYIQEMNSVIADRQFVKDIATGTAKDGRPLALPEGRLSKKVDPDGNLTYLADPRARKTVTDAAGDVIDQADYKRVDQHALAEWNWEGKDNEGNPIFMRDNLLLHPEAARRLKAMTGTSALKQWYRSEGSVGTAIPKKLVQALDVSQSVMKREMFGLINLFHHVQEGTHAIGHMVNPITFGEKIDPMRNPAQQAAMRNGLMLLPDRATMNSYLEGVGADRTFVSRALRKGGPAGNAVADVLDKHQDLLFHSYIPQLKFKTYEAMNARNTKLFAKELASGELTDRDVGMLSASQANAAYGHLNYTLLDRSPTVQHFIHLAALAPDFLEARGRFTAQAAKTLLGSKAGVEQIKAIATLAAVQAGLAYTISQVTGGQWDAKHPFEVRKDGRRYFFRSVPEDIASALDEPTRFAMNRVSPLVTKGGIELATGRNYRGEEISKVDTLTDLMAGYIPIVARSAPGLRELTETSRNSPTSPLEQLAGSLGLRISRYSPINKTYELAETWMEKQGLPKDKGVYPISKYQQYRYALEDGDQERAKVEYKKLRETMNAGQISKGIRDSVLRPFTKDATTDKKFRASLKPDEQALYNQALLQRKKILMRSALPAFK